MGHPSTRGWATRPYTIYVLDKDRKTIKVIEVYTPESESDVFKLLEDADIDFSFGAEQAEDPHLGKLRDVGEK